MDALLAPCTDASTDEWKQVKSLRIAPINSQGGQVKKLLIYKQQRNNQRKSKKYYFVFR